MISSRQNRKLKDMRRLKRSKGDRVLLEGPHLLAEALASGVPLADVLVSPAFARSDEGSALIGRLRCPVEEVAPDLLAGIADADTPQGALAVAELPRPACAALPRRSGGVYLYLDGIQDPGNLGAIARVAEATGVTAVACAAGTAHPNHPRALRASAGSLLRLPVAPAVAASELAAHLRPLQPEWVALAAHGGAEIYDAPLDGTLVLALGGEGPGLSAETAALAGTRLTIPLLAPVESLNVATAAAVVLFERLRRQRPALAASATGPVSSRA
jgi:TrmH family RNA methyltransferase